jgi:hypothetical protein
MARTFTITAAIASVLLGLPARANAQRVQVDVSVSAEISRELRDALRDVANGVSDTLRDVSRDINRDLGREIAQGLRDLPKHGRLGAWDGGWSMAQERNWRGRAEDRQTRSLAIGPNGTLELHNLSGDVTITAGGAREASVQLIRRSRGLTDADAKLGLERVKVDSQVVGNRATVRADYPNERQSTYSVSVDMIVTAPVGTRVVVNSVSADVKVTGIRGELSVTTISGSVTLTNVGAVSDAKTASGDVSIIGSTGDGALDAGTLSGDVILQQVKARSVHAGTVSGSVTAHDVTCEAVTLVSMSGDAVFSGELARNGRYEITSHSGDVRFTPAGTVGFTLVASSFSGDISSSLPLQSDGTRARRRALTGKVGDGSATVTLQTFNGDITVGGAKR